MHVPNELRVCLARFCPPPISTWPREVFFCRRRSAAGREYERDELPSRKLTRRGKGPGLDFLLIPIVDRVGGRQ